MSKPDKKAANQKPGKIVLLPVEQIEPSPFQARTAFDETEIAALAVSILQNGLLQPISVRKTGYHKYQLVAGERRLRACQLAKMTTIPAILCSYADDRTAALGLLENIQRADLNAIEEAASYRQLMDRFGHTQEKLADALNKSRSHIANLLRLLNLPEQVQAWLKEGKLSAGHARALITAPNAVELARKVIEKGLSVRETEELVRRQAEAKVAKPARPRAEKDADTRALEGDPQANWAAHNKDIHDRRDYLNSLHIRQLKYRSANSTVMQRFLIDLCFMVVL